MVEGSGTGSLTNSIARATLLASTASSTALQLGSSGVVRATIASDGNVGIGTTDPQKALEISKANTSGGGVIRLAGTGETSAGCAAGSIQFYNGDTTDYTPGVFGIIRGVAGPSGGEGHLQFLTDMPSAPSDGISVKNCK